MGSDITQVSAENSYDFLIRELEQSLLDKGFDMIEKKLDTTESKGKIEAAFKEQVMGK